MIAAVPRLPGWVFAAAGALLVAAGLLVTTIEASTPSLEERGRAVAAGLRCPICRSQTVADSPTPLARQMRTTIEEQLRAGRSPEQVRRFFVARYGEQILLDPSPRGIGLVAWLGPPILWVVGALALALGARRHRGVQRLSPDDHARLRRELEAGGA
ncbi:MAG TPA: cytochrome c-type biogenesis protein [Actinomycetota bacterium]|nr:cytochrome c-type biogenesis protein [Actinomycetota bacterium]